MTTFTITGATPYQLSVGGDDANDVVVRVHSYGMVSEAQITRDAEWVRDAFTTYLAEHPEAEQVRRGVTMPNVSDFTADPDRYFLKAEGYDWHPVDRETFIARERACGFYPKGGGNRPATASFSGHGWQGRVVYGGNTEGWDWS